MVSLCHSHCDLHYPVIISFNSDQPYHLCTSPIFLYKLYQTGSDQHSHPSYVSFYTILHYERSCNIPLIYIYCIHPLSSNILNLTPTILFNTALSHISTLHTIILAQTSCKATLPKNHIRQISPTHTPLYMIVILLQLNFIHPKFRHQLNRL